MSESDSFDEVEGESTVVINPKSLPSFLNDEVVDGEESAWSHEKEVEVLELQPVDEPPPWINEEVIGEHSAWTHNRETRLKQDSVTRAKLIREKNKRLKCIFEDEGMEFNSDMPEEEFHVRFKEAMRIREKRINGVLEDLKLARNVDLCFLVDATGSMQSYIDGVRETINAIVTRLTTKPKKSVRFAMDNPLVEGIRIAFVAYRDIRDVVPFEVLSFTKSVSEFSEFVKGVKASGGADGPEDVFGGLEEMFKLNWTDKFITKVVFHIADSPCHGTEFHDWGRTGDDFPDGDPKGRTHTDLFNRMRREEIQYHFGKLNSTTDKMIEKFSEAYGEPIVDFDIKHVDKICESVITAVSTSVSETLRRTATLGGIKREARVFKFVKCEPDWTRLEKQKGIFVTYKFPNSIEDIISDVPLERNKPKHATVQIAKYPFAQGAERVAYYGRDIIKQRVASDEQDLVGNESVLSTLSSYVMIGFNKLTGDCTKMESIVLKEYKFANKEMNSARRFEITHQIQIIAAYLAGLFMKELKEKAKKEVNIKFLKTKTLTIQKPNGDLRLMSCERRYARDELFIRFTNNADYAMLESTAVKHGIDIDFVNLLMTFSHWTHQVSKGNLMVVDLQGTIGISSGISTITLTDPAIHCLDVTKFGSMNLGSKGMENFFGRHECNNYCESLKLVRPRMLE